MNKPDLFQIPNKSLQKHCKLRGKNVLESIPDYINIKKRMNDINYKKEFCNVPHSILLMQNNALDKFNNAKRVMNQAVAQGEAQSEIIQVNVEELDKRKNKLMDELAKIEEKYLENLKSRENYRLETLSKITDYMSAAQQFKREKEKQDILVRIGFIVESTLEDLSPYEEMLGRLALQENAFKSKADTLLVKKDILLVRKDNLNAKLQTFGAGHEEIKKKLFKRTFELGDGIYYRVNLINKLQEIDIKSMRAVLDLELRLAAMRKKAETVRSENAWLYWFLDWVLFDIIGQDSLAGISPESSPQEKTQCIIDYYKNLKNLLNTLHGKPVVGKLL